MKKQVLGTLIIGLLLILIMPIILLVVGLGTPSQYDKTYYAQLYPMYVKLKNSQGKKIVLVGNSAVAFGVDSALMEKELRNHGLEYSVVNFGLYGALGTKLMMELSREYIGQDDIVIFMPEPYEQGMSLYFSAQETWRSMDGNMEMIEYLPFAEKGKLVGGYSAFVAEKYHYIQEGGAEGSGVYAKTSFDENGDLKNYARAQNTMLDGYDANWMVEFNIQLLSEEFVAYVNEYTKAIRAKGAEIYFCLSPVNERGLTEGTEENLDSFCDEIYNKLNLLTLGNPHSSIMSAEWFYDSNFHLNDAGMAVYSSNLVESIKTKLEITAPSNILLPTMPQLPQQTPQGVGDNNHLSFFTYEELEDNSVIVTGLTEEGREQISLIMPYSYNGKIITAFSSQVFAGNTIIEEITLQTNIRRIVDNSFYGCASLKKLILKHEQASQIGIGAGLLEGAENCRIYVPTKAVSDYKNNYFWGYYASKLVAQ